MPSTLLKPTASARRRLLTTPPVFAREPLQPAFETPASSLESEFARALGGFASSQNRILMSATKNFPATPFSKSSSKEFVWTISPRCQRRTLTSVRFGRGDAFGQHGAGLLEAAKRSAET